MAQPEFSSVATASAGLYAVITLNLADSTTSLRVEMLAGYSRSIIRKQGRVIPLGMLPGVSGGLNGGLVRNS